MIETARFSFFEFPQNTNLLICFFRNFISNQYFYAFFLQAPCIETPFDFISLLYSDTAHDINEQEREQFDISLMSNCILLIGDFFNFDLIVDMPHLESSISQLLYNIKCPKQLISYSAIEGTLKALKISPQNTIDMIFDENIFSYLIMMLSNNGELNDDEKLFDQLNEMEDGNANESLNQEEVNISVLNLIYFIIKYDEQNQYFTQIIDSISDELHELMQKSEIYQIKALKILLILSQSYNYNDENLLIKLEATNDAIRFLITDTPFNLKSLSFKYFISLMKFPDYQFFKDYMTVFEYISQVICSFSIDDICTFIQSLKTLLDLFYQRNDDSLNAYLVQIGLVDELSSLANNDNDENDISEIAGFVSCFQADEV